MELGDKPTKIVGAEIRSPGKLEPSKGSSPLPWNAVLSSAKEGGIKATRFTP